MMNQHPVSYLQIDPKWKNVDYSAKGEKTTIGASGCGPTSMAMVLATWANPSVTPKTECAWALAHGYKAPHQGTYYGYFEPAAKRYGLVCTRVNTVSIYGNAYSTHHARVKQAVDSGHLVIACMGEGNWTRSGHYVLVWKIDGNTIFINDPASTRTVRTRGNYSLFKKQVKYYWIINRPDWIGKKEDDMTEKEVKNIINNLDEESAYKLLLKAISVISKKPESDWSFKEGSLRRAVKNGITDGSRPQSFATREEVVALVERFIKLHGGE